jgi:hypothetical protein
MKRFFMQKYEAVLLIVIAALFVLSMPTPARAECYPSSNSLLSLGNSDTPDCLTVDSYLNGSNQTVPVTATAPLPVTVGASAVTIAFPTGDVCMNPSIAKSSASISISTATTTLLVAAVAAKIIYVCSLNFTTGGTTPTYQFKYGTQVTNPCDTGPANLSGAFAPTSGSTFLAMGSGVLMQTIASQQLCVTTGGTIPAANGFISYVQQ